MNTHWMMVFIGLIALSTLSMAVTFYWLAKALIKSSASLQQLIEDVDRNVQKTVEGLQGSIRDINGITGRVGDQMDRVDGIVDNVEHITKDARSSVHIVEETVVPLLVNLKAGAAGVRRGLEVWNDKGQQNGGPENNV